MKKIIQIDAFSDVLYEENIWTGKPSLSINGSALSKTDKKTFILPNNKEAKISGNYFSGIKITVENNVVQISNPMKWYEITIAVAFFVLTIVWSNIPTLCSIIPLVGGAVGGAISGLCNGLGIFLCASKEKPVERLIYVLGGGILSFLSCMAVGFIVLGILS